MSSHPSNIPCTSCPSWKFSLFSHLPDSQICVVSGGKKLNAYGKGQLLYYQGTKPLGIFCIKSGVVKVYNTASNGKEQILRLAQNGEFLGCAALLGEESYSSSSMIIEEAKICFVPRDIFMRSLLHNSEFSRKVAKSLSHEIGIMEEKLTNATQKTMRERLAHALLQLGNDYGVGDGENKKINLTLTRKDLAGIVGTTPESVIRLLYEFKIGKLIGLEGKTIILKDLKSLTRMTDFYGE